MTDTKPVEFTYHGCEILPKDTPFEHPLIEAVRGNPALVVVRGRFTADGREGVVLMVCPVWVLADADVDLDASMQEYIEVFLSTNDDESRELLALPVH